MYRYVPTAIAALAVVVLLGTPTPVVTAQGPAWCPWPGAYYGDSWLSSYYSYPYASGSYAYQPYSQYYPQAYYSYYSLPPEPPRSKTIYVQQPCPTPEPVYVYVQPQPCPPQQQTVYVQPSQPYVVVDTAITAPNCGYIPHDIGWGSFGTYDNWARAFEQQHCRQPNAQDECDFWWSQQFAASTGFSPYSPSWCWDCANK